MVPKKVKSSFLVPEKVILLDFGSVREFPREFIESYIKLIQSIENKDFDAYRRMIQHVGFLTEDADIPLIKEHFKIISELYLPYIKEGIYPVDQRNPFKMIEGLVPKNAGLQSTKSANFPISTEPTSSASP